MRHPSVGRMSRAAPPIGAALVLALGSPAQATSGGPVTLTWDAPAGCPTAEEVLGDVDRTLAQPGAPPTPVMATVQVSAEPDGTWQASLSLDVRGARTERRFRAESCGAIAAATAVILAIAVEDASEAPPTTASLASASESPRATTPPSTPGASTSHFFVAANGVVDWDTMPTPPALGYEAAVGRSWSLDRWRLRWIGGADLYPSHAPPTAPYIGTVNGAFWLVGVSGRGCVGVALSRLEIGPCLGAELAVMHASNGGDADPAAPNLARQTHYWLSLLGSIAVSWNASPSMDVVLRGDFVVPTQRDVFGIENNVLADYRVPTWAFRGALGIEARFP